MAGVTNLNPEQAQILIVGIGINFIAGRLQDLANESLRLHLTGRKLYLCSMKGDVLEILGRSGYFDRLGEDNISCPTSRLSGNSCLPGWTPRKCCPCNARIFNECEKMPGVEGDRLRC